MGEGIDGSSRCVLAAGSVDLAHRQSLAPEKGKYMNSVSTLTEVRPLAFITGIHEVRPLNPAYVEKLRAKIREIGVKPYPLSVTPDGILFGGRHRFEAFKAEGFTEALMHISTPASLDREAIELNRASEDALPMTFVDEAELIWRKLEKGQTQQAVADDLGWSREKVTKYSGLSKICFDAWQIVGTTFRDAPLVQEGDAVPNFGTTVPFTEGCLRHIVQLEPAQQLELVRDLRDGKITKNKLQTQAENYRARNEAREWFLAQAGGLEDELLEDGIAGIARGLYDSEWKTSKGPGPKLTKLLESARERHHKKHSIVMINGDFYVEVKRIGDDSIDAVITDPPYNISTDRVYKLAKQADWDKNFGDWDNKSDAEFISNLATWAQEFFRIMRAGASGFMFVGEDYLNIAKALFDEAGFDIKGTFFWCRKNPGTSVTKADFMPAMDFAIQFVKPGAKRTFTYPGDVEGKNYRECAICGGNERLKSPKGVTLHPTQKPESIIRHLMELITVPGDVVFDGFMGVGTTAKVAKDLGRKFVGFELDKTYFVAAQDRLSD
jgi:site-specific DNA-methyltransferase (adenine-specific)